MKGVRNDNGYGAYHTDSAPDPSAGCSERWSAPDTVRDHDDLKLRDRAPYSARGCRALHRLGSGKKGHWRRGPGNPSVLYLHADRASYDLIHSGDQPLASGDNRVAVSTLIYVLEQCPCIT